MRPYCADCSYPLKTCLCDNIAPIDVPIQVFIVQHAKESDHPKNTARLAALCSPNINIVRTDDSKAMARLSLECSIVSSALLFPSEGSIALEAHQNALSQRLDTLVIIDGSWRQAYAILQKFSWLQSLHAYHFTHSPSTQYRIRHTKFAQGLSTLEATAYAISALYKTDVTPLYAIQKAMQDNWRGPIEHQRNVDQR